MNLQSAQGAVLVSESRTPSSFDFKGELLTLIATEKKKTSPEFRRSFSHFGVEFCRAIVGQEARQWPDLRHAKHFFFIYFF